MDFGILSLVRAVGIFQGLLLGIILIVVSKKNKSTLFLGLFLLGFSVEFVPELLSDLEFLDYNPRQLLFLLNFSWIIFPLFFIYVQKISIIPKDRIRYWVIRPGIIAVLIHLALGLSNRDFTNWLLENTYTYQFLYIASLAYSLFIVHRINQLIREHKQEVRNQYSQPDNRMLEWTRFFAFFCFALVATRIAALFMERSEVLHLVMSGLNIVIIALIAISGIFQFNVFNVLANRSGTGASIKQEQSPAPLTETKANELLTSMDVLMKESAMYLRQDLTIADVSQSIEQHPKTISTALNTYYKKNFNTYINEFRIRKAEELLRSGYAASKSIEGLSQEVGFRSKTSFYRAFKENAGMTPNEYVKQISS